MAPIISTIKSLLSNPNDTLKKVKNVILKSPTLRNGMQRDWLFFVYKSPNLGIKEQRIQTESLLNAQQVQLRKSQNLSNVTKDIKSKQETQVPKESEGRFSHLYNLDIQKLLEDIKQKLSTTKTATAQKVPQWKTERPKITQEGVNCRTTHILSLLTTESPATLLKILEDLLNHLIQYPEAKQYAVQAGAVRRLLHIKKNCKHENILSTVRQVLSILGYANPPCSSGVRILSIDGGGMRGVAVIRMLEKLEELSGKRILELFDFICGTSTGAIITCCLLPPHAMTLNDVKNLYRNLSTQVFTQSAFWGTSKLVWSHAYYDTGIWENLLRSYVGETKMLESVRTENCPKAAVISTIVNQSKVAPFIFRNYSNPYNRNSDYTGSCNHTMFEAVRASAAAPTIFEEFKIGDILHQDGGMVVNNPTAVAVHEARTLWPDENIKCVVSCGTGRIVPVLEIKSSKPAPTKSSTSWKNIFDKILESATDTEGVHTILNDLLPEDIYFRLNPHLSRKVTMDEINESKISILEADTEMYYRRNKDKFQDIVNKLVAPRKKRQFCNDHINLQLKLFGYYQ